MLSKPRRVSATVPTRLGRGLHRVGRAIIDNAPAHIQMGQREESDLTIYHVVGLEGLRELIAEDVAAGREYAIVQYCLLTTEDSRPEAWAPIWQKARAVWTYYDLETYLRDRGIGLWSAGLDAKRLYHAPLGVDGDVFRPSMPSRKTFIIGTSGFVAETEGVRECYAAARRIGRDQFHLGPDLKLGAGVAYMLGVSDADVADMWSSCSYVAGLRRIEGFELPALEALACGSRPIMFDAPHYRHWFGEHADYVPEASFDEVVDALEAIMRGPVRAVTPAEREDVVTRFDWRALAAGFWERLEV